MKKVLALILAVAMLSSFAACGVQPVEDDPVDKNYVYDADNSTTTTEEETTTTEMSTTTAAETETEAWRTFLNGYEEWVDDYVAIVKKYKDNPTDMSILADYTAMAAEVTEWASKADDMEGELDDPLKLLNTQQNWPVS